MVRPFLTSVFLILACAVAQFYSCLLDVECGHDRCCGRGALSYCVPLGQEGDPCHGTIFVSVPPSCACAPGLVCQDYSGFDVYTHLVEGHGVCRDPRKHTTSVGHNNSPTAAAQTTTSPPPSVATTTPTIAATNTIPQLLIGRKRSV